MTKKKSKKDIKAERKMLVSVIEKAVRSEKENSLDDFPALVVANEKKNQTFEFNSRCKTITRR